MLKQLIDKVGMKKLGLLMHYFLAILVSLTFFATSAVCTFTPQEIDMTVLLQLYLQIMTYCGIVITYITILSLFDKMQTMNKKNAKFDWIAFYIGLCLFITLSLIIVCIIYMFTREMNEITSKLWITLISIFGSMFIVESGGGYFYKGFKNKVLAKFGLLSEQKNSENDNINEINEN